MSNASRPRTAVEPLETRVLFASLPLDVRFSGDGVVSSALNGGYNNARAVAVQSDGKVIVVGDAKFSASSSTYGFAAIRYNADGTLDDGGPNDSTPDDHFGTAGRFIYGQGVSSIPTSLAIQRDGKIVIAGSASSGGSTPQQYWLMVRLNTNGTLDKTFGDNGVAGNEFSLDNTPLTGVALQSDGKIVAVGSENGDFLVARFTTSGEFDDTFADFGSTRIDFGGNDSASGVAIDKVGNIVIVGGVGGDGLNQNLGVARLQTDGTPDPNFATNGKGVYETGLHRMDVVGAVITDDGKIQVAESIYTPGVGANWDSTIYHVGNSGEDAGSDGVDDHKYTAITTMANGRIAMSGIDLSTSGTGKFFVELSGTGSGTIYSGSGSATATATAIAAAPDGTVIVAGGADVSGGRNITLSKLVGVSPSSWGAISGNIFRDVDGDGVKDSNESGMPNVRVYVDFDNDGQWEPTVQGFPNEPSVLTDAKGNYVIKNFRQATAQIIREIVPAATTQESPATTFFSVIPVLGKTVGGKNFINKPVAVASSQTAVKGSVFNDYNNNGKRETTGAIEPDIAKVVVFIDANKNGKLDAGELSTKTDVSGNYTLNLSAAGHYRVAVSLPKGYINTSTRYADLTVHTHTQGVARFAIAPADVDDSIAEVKGSAAVNTSKSVNGALASGTDVNLYRFTVTASQSIWFDLDLASGSSLNSYLRLFDSAGKQLAANDNGVAPGESTSLDSYIKYHFTKAGTYYIAVSDHLNKSYSALTGAGDVGGGTSGKYVLNFHASK